MTYFSMILIGLYVLHNKKIVHRDLKPENILIFEILPGNYILKVCDFGVSKDFSSSNNTNVSVKDHFTFACAAPEQLDMD